MKETIGWIGTGLMGRPMCQKILNAGHTVYAYNRSRNKAELLQSPNLIICNSPQEVAKKCGLIFSIVGYPEDVSNIFLGQNGCLDHAMRGAILVDMTTSNPSLAKKLYNIGQEKRVSFLDAPVSGGVLGAENGDLSVMVGGEKEAFLKIQPILELFGNNIQYLGSAGSGQNTKMCNQILIASSMIGVVEALLYAVQCNLNLEQVISTLETGAAGSWSLTNLGRKMVQKDYAPGFYIKHFIKDMQIALDECRKYNLALPGLSLAHQFYMSAAAHGLDNLGTQALYKILSDINGMED